MDGERRFRDPDLGPVAASLRFWPSAEGGPWLFQDVTMLTFSVTFRPETLARCLPPGLQPCDEATGGVEFLLARRGPVPGCFTATTIWFDLASPRGDLVAPRFAAARFGAQDLPGLDPVTPGQTQLCDDGQVMTADLSVHGRSLLRASLRPGRSAYPAAGVTTYLGRPMDPGAVVPWSARLPSLMRPR